MLFVPRPPLPTRLFARTRSFHTPLFALSSLFKRRSPYIHLAPLPCDLYHGYHTYITFDFRLVIGFRSFNRAYFSGPLLVCSPVSTPIDSYSLNIYALVCGPFSWLLLFDPAYWILSPDSCQGMWTASAYSRRYNNHTVSCMVPPKTDSDVKPVSKLQNNFKSDQFEAAPALQNVSHPGKRCKIQIHDAVADYGQSTSFCV